MGGLVDALKASIEAMAGACRDASRSLVDNGYVTDDMPLISGQVQRAAETVAQLGAILDGDGDRDEVFVLLHQVNNQLTGVLSLTLLVKDDIPASHASRPLLDVLDRSSRNAAAHVKDVATALKGAASASA